MLFLVCVLSLCVSFIINQVHTFMSHIYQHLLFDCAACVAQNVGRSKEMTLRVSRMEWKIPMHFRLELPSMKTVFIEGRNEKKIN